MWDCSALEDDLGPAALGAGSPEPVLWFTVRRVCISHVLPGSTCDMRTLHIRHRTSSLLICGRCENIQRAQLTFTFTGAESIFIKTSRFLLNNCILGGQKVCISSMAFHPLSKRTSWRRKCIQRKFICSTDSLWTGPHL